MPPDPFLADAMRAQWRTPGVVSLTSTRAGGVSAAPWNSLNLGIAVNDDPAHVAQNRSLFAGALHGARPVFMQQVHGTRVLFLTAVDVDAPLQQADAAITIERGLACTVQVADCMPVLMAAPGGVGAAHAGWRGLASGVVEATLQALCDATGCEPAQVECWLGPCIGPEAFEVGADVLAGFGVAPESADAERFKPLAGRPGKWLANLPLLARDRLEAAGVVQVSGGTWCTFTDSSRFFSYRRDSVTGRMAAAIWRT